MQTLKTLAVVLFFSPCLILLLLWASIAYVSESQKKLILEIYEMFTNCMQKGFGLANQREKYLLDTALDVAFHFSMIFWIAVFVFSIG